MIRASLLLLLALLPNPMDAVIAERQMVSRAVQEQAERIEELRGGQ